MILQSYMWADRLKLKSSRIFPFINELHLVDIIF